MKRLVAIISLLLVACEREPPPQFPTYTPAEGNPALMTAEDVAVYEAVIAGYAQAGQILMMKKAPGPPPGQPITSDELERVTAKNEVRVRPYTSKAHDFEPPADRWWTLDGRRLEHLAVRGETVKDFKARNGPRASIKAFRPRNLHIEWTEEMETMRCLYVLTLPGYSPSRDEAVVEISCGMWALAGGGELLYLKRENGSWRVVAKLQTWIS